MIEQRRTFHTDLDELRNDVVRLGASATEMILASTELLLDGDLARARTVVDADDEVDLLALDIEERSYQLLALQQPMAGDLRSIVTAIRLVSEFERSADLAVNMTKAARRMYGSTLEPLLRGLIEQMSEEAVRLLRLATDAYAEGNAGLAAALDDIDDRLDDLHRQFIQAIFSSHRKGGLDLEAAVQLALVGRYYERIGDHAVNVGSRVQYMVTGWLPEHTGAARARARAHDQPEPQGPSGPEDRGGGPGVAPEAIPDGEVGE